MRELRLYVSPEQALDGCQTVRSIGSSVHAHRSGPQFKRGCIHAKFDSAERLSGKSVIIELLTPRRPSFLLIGFDALARITPR
jgi:hypothetical protein